MGVPLHRAWEICRILEEEDAAHDWDNEVARADTLSDNEPRPAFSAPTRSLSDRDPAAAERIESRRGARLGA